MLFQVAQQQADEGSQEVHLGGAPDALAAVGAGPPPEHLQPSMHGEPSTRSRHVTIHVTCVLAVRQGQRVFCMRSSFWCCMCNISAGPVAGGGPHRKQLPLYLTLKHAVLHTV